jgi:hypothetical protein
MIETQGPAESRTCAQTRLWPRWIFLRALGLIYFSAFYSLLFQIKGLIGPNGILPAGDYLAVVSAAIHGLRFWSAPTLFWFSSSDRAMAIVCWAGLIASLLVIFNVWPRMALVICFVCFLSFVSVAQDFAGFQSDGMLLEAGFLSLFFAPSGFLPGLSKMNALSQASFLLLLWEWYCVYFESGVVKIASGDKSWRKLSALDDYYQNGPLPTWIGWYAQKLPHEVHAATVILTLAVELFVVWMVFLPRRFRIACFCIVTPFQLGIALTANYAFLNYLLLSLGFLLLDDRLIEAILPRKIRSFIDRAANSTGATSSVSLPTTAPLVHHGTVGRLLLSSRTLVAELLLALIFYVTAIRLLSLVIPGLPFPNAPARWIAPFRVADRYGVFANMTHARYEIEFQGSTDAGKTWIAYPFRYKPQQVNRAPGIYAPYQPRFDWNLWFASSGPPQNNPFVLSTKERLLKNESDVLALFAGNPFPNPPPQEVRTVLYQYWFTDFETKRRTGAWWRQELLGEYGPSLERGPDGRIAVHDVQPINQNEP